jgi:hypothetical protein
MSFGKLELTSAKPEPSKVKYQSAKMTTIVRSCLKTTSLGTVRFFGNDSKKGLGNLFHNFFPYKREITLSKSP